MAEQLIGKVTHYFGKAGVAAIEITEGELRVGDTIHILGHTSDFTQTVDSMQVDRAPVQSAKAGDSIGIRVDEHARENDSVFKVVPDSMD
jgi:putative protease